MKAMKQSNHELSHLDISGTDHFMCKFGLSNDLSRRIYEQFVAYTKNFKGSSFKMLLFIPINDKLKYKAEKNLADFFRERNKMINLKGYNELVMLTKEDIMSVEAKYMELSEMYGVAGDMKAVMGENNVLTNQLQEWNNRETHWNSERQTLTTQLRPIRPNNYDTRD